MIWFWAGQHVSSYKSQIFGESISVPFKRECSYKIKIKILEIIVRTSAYIHLLNKFKIIYFYHFYHYIILYYKIELSKFQIMNLNSHSNSVKFHHFKIFKFTTSRKITKYEKIQEIVKVFTIEFYWGVYGIIT